MLSDVEPESPTLPASGRILLSRHALSGQTGDAQRLAALGSRSFDVTGEPLSKDALDKGGPDNVSFVIVGLDEGGSDS